MRSTAVVAGLMIVASAAAQPSAPARAVIAVPEAEVRSGPSTQYQVAAKLKRGDAVSIVRDEHGWLAIIPPPGSVSFVNDKLIDFRTDKDGKQIAVILAIDGAPVRAGSTLGKDPEPLRHETVKLQRGTLIRVVGPQVVAENQTWWPIEPTVDEVRYVAREAVYPDQSGTTLAGSATPGTPTARSRPGEPLAWAQAEAAERAGNLKEAEELYQRLAAEQARPGGDHDLAIRCYNRAHAVREKLAAAGQPVSQPRPGAAPQPSSSPSLPPGSQASGPGWLRRSGTTIDGQPAYLLQPPQGGQARLLATPNPGQTLEPYVDRYVELYGPISYRGDLRAYHMPVQRLSLLR